MFKKIKEFLLINKTTRQTVAKNTFWMIAGQFGSRLIKAAIIIYAARILGAEQWGVFSYTLSLAAFFTIFTDFGLSAVVTRESSKDLSLQEKYFSTSIIIKLVMTLAVIIIIFTLAPLIIKQEAVRALLPIVIILTCLDGLRDFGASLSRAWEKMEIEALIQIFTNLAIVIGGFIALYLLPTAWSLSIGYTVGITLGTIAAFYPFRHYIKNFGKNFSRQLIKPIIFSSWLIGITGLMGAAMLNTDVLMIGWFRSIKDVGYYSAGQRITLLIYLLPNLFAGALFPTLVKSFYDREKFKKVLERSLVILTILSIPITIGGALLSKEIIHLLYGKEYYPAINSFIVMNLTYITVFLSAILASAFFIIKERVLLKFAAAGFFGNLFFNLLLIPPFGITGSAISTLFTQILTTSYLSYQLKKEIRFSFLPKIKKIIAASLIMGVSTAIISYLGINVVINIIVSGVIYLLLLIIFKEENVSEIKRSILKRQQ